MTADNSRVIADAMQSKNEIFIQKAIKIHGLRYDYSDIDYKTNHTHIEIICRTHGPFLQTPKQHIKGVGCKKCAHDSFRMGKEEFIRKARIKHGDKFDYSLVDYKSNKDLVKIICPEHGIFETKPNNHLLKKIACPDCKYVGFKEFCKRANLIHSGRYAYVDNDFKRMSDKVLIICSTHGKFEQIATNHLKGYGCPKCSVVGLNRAAYVERSKEKYDGLCWLYLIKCFNGAEVFYKAGMTLQGVENRYNSKMKMPYDYEIVCEVQADVDLVWGVEKEVHRLLYKFKYRPEIEFSGHLQECYLRIPKRVLNLFEGLKSNEQLYLM